MAKKASITSVATGYQSATTFDNNFNAINNKLDNTLSLDGSTPNAMNADLDLNSQDLLNGKTAYVQNIVATSSVSIGGTTFTGSGVVTEEQGHLADFGVVGDTVITDGLYVSGTDDTTNLQAAFNWVTAVEGRKLLGEPGKVYYITDTIEVSGFVNIDWNGARVHTDQNITMFKFETSATFVDLDSDYTATATSVAATTSSALTAGRWVKIISNALDPMNRDKGSEASQHRCGEYIRVGEGATTSSIPFATPLRYAYGISPTSTAGDEARELAYTTANNARIVIPEEKSFYWKGGTFSYEEGEEATFNKSLLSISGYVGGVDIDSMTITRGYSHGIKLRGCCDVSIRNCRISNLENNTANAQYGYGVSAGGCANTSIRDCSFFNCRHGVTTSAGVIPADSTNAGDVLGSGRTIHGSVTDCYAWGFGNASAFDTHHDASFWTFANCKVVNSSTYGFTARGEGIVYTNPIGVNVNGGIHVLSDYNSGDTDDDLWLNGKAEEDFTSCSIINPSFLICGNPGGSSCEWAIKTGHATVDIEFASPITSVCQKFMRLRGNTRVSGHTTFSVDHYHNAYNYIADNGEHVIEVVDRDSDAGSELAQRLVFENGADIRAVVTAATSTGFSAIYADTNCTIDNRGKVYVKLPAGFSFFTTSGTVQTEDNGIFEISLASGTQASTEHNILNHKVKVRSEDGSIIWNGEDAADGEPLKNLYATFTAVNHTGTGAEVTGVYEPGTDGMHEIWNAWEAGDALVGRFIIRKTGGSGNATVDLNIGGAFVDSWSLTDGLHVLTITGYCIDGTNQEYAIDLRGPNEETDYKLETQTTSAVATGYSFDVNCPSGDIVSFKSAELTGTRGGKIY